MNSALLAAQQLACMEPRPSMRAAIRNARLHSRPQTQTQAKTPVQLQVQVQSRVQAQAQARQNFASYFVEQSIALLGTWLQQVILAWLTHGAVHGPQILSAVNPQLGAVITTVCSALTWVLLMVWTFKLRERFRQFTIALGVVKANLSTIVRLCLLNWARKGHRHCF